MSETIVINDAWHHGNCQTCKHSAADPDGAYCAHPDSIKASGGFGQGGSLARSTRGVCGPDASLYEQCTCTNKYCPRHTGRKVRT